jgi:hypothetical protein
MLNEFYFIYGLLFYLFKNLVSIFCTICWIFYFLFCYTVLFSISMYQEWSQDLIYCHKILNILELNFIISLSYLKEIVSFNFVFEICSLLIIYLHYASFTRCRFRDVKIWLIHESTHTLLKINGSSIGQHFFY